MLVGSAVADFGAWVQSRTGVQAITAVRAQADAIQHAETERALRRLSHLSEQDQNVVRALAIGIANKMVHAPTLALRTAQNDDDIDRILSALGVDRR